MKIVFVLLLSFITTFHAGSVKADNFGCKVILCLAAPAGLPECADTLSKLFKRLAKGKSFPSCDFSDGGVAGASSIKSNTGIAAWVPKHKVCVNPIYTKIKRSPKEAKEHGSAYKSVYQGCGKTEERGGYYDHERSCSQIFPVPSNVRYKDRRETAEYRQQQKCRSKSKNWVRVTGDGIESEYHYY